MKTVAIVGAGPSGLVTAKTLLRSKSCQYQVTIFEKTSEIGGLWAAHRERPYDGLLNPDMPTNLSRFNIGFSDLAWSSVGLEGHVPYWPRAWQVGQYLRAYTDKYLAKDVIRFNSTVTSVAAAGTGGDHSPWKVQWETSAGDGPSSKSESVFDYLIIATGFFGASSTPDLGADNLGIRIAHSTKLRKLADVIPQNEDISGTLLVVGGGMSGADAATVLASQISNAKFCPTGDERKYGRLQLVQLCPEAAYALPLAAPCDRDEPGAPHFLPLDLCMYKLDKRPPGQIDMMVGQMPEDAIKVVHESFQGLVGDQSDLGVAGLTFKDTSRTAYVTLTEQYSGFIRSGDIKIVMGRLDGMQQAAASQSPGKSPVHASYTYADKTHTVDNVVGVVYATGYTPQHSLDFLSPQLREALEHDLQNNRLPVLLDEHATLHSGVPGLAIIGFHEGAFWGSMEMEARLVERRWSGQSQQDGVTNGQSGKTTERLKQLRMAMTNRDKDVPQYWMGDYVGLMEQLGRETGVTRDELDFPERSGPVAVARYTDETCDRRETATILAEYAALLSASTKATMFVGRAAFLGLQGNWEIGRTITSNLDSMPDGSLTGTASFHPRFPTDPAYDFEYLYVERGKFTMSSNSGMTMNATRRYVYRYHEATDKVTVWFVKDDGTTVDYLYHGLTFDPDARRRGWLARADHLCVADMYRSDYLFNFRGANVSALGVTHAVKGPKKDYVSETWYVR